MHKKTKLKLKSKSEPLRGLNVLDYTVLSESASNVTPALIKGCLDIHVEKDIPEEWDDYLEREYEEELLGLFRKKGCKKILIVGKPLSGKTLLALKAIYRLNSDYIIFIPREQSLDKLCNMDFQGLSGKKVIIFLDDVNHYMEGYSYDRISRFDAGMSLHATDTIFIATIRENVLRAITDEFARKESPRYRFIGDFEKTFHVQWTENEKRKLAGISRGFKKAGMERDYQTKYDLFLDDRARALLFCFTLLYEKSIRTISKRDFEDFFIELFGMKYDSTDYAQAFDVLQSNGFLKSVGEELSCCHESTLDVEQAMSKSNYEEKTIDFLFKKKFFEALDKYIDKLWDVEKDKEAYSLGERVLKCEALPPQVRANVLFYLCHCYRRYGDVQEAKRKGAECITIHKDEFPDIVYATWDELGLAYYYNWELPESVACAEKAIGGLVKIENDNKKNKKPEDPELTRKIARVYENLSADYLYNGRIKEASECLKDCEEYFRRYYKYKEIARHERARIDLTECWLKLAEEGKTKQDVGNLQELLTKTEEEYRGKGKDYSYKVGIAFCYVIRGLLLNELNKKDEAKASFEQALELAATQTYKDRMVEHWCKEGEKGKTFWEIIKKTSDAELNKAKEEVEEDRKKYSEKPETEIEVNFSKEKKYIKINDKEIKITKKQEFLLLEELLNEKIVHWSSGFVIFEGWQDKVPIRGPINQFRSEVSGLNGVVEFKLVVASKKKGCWEFSPNIKIESTIDKANEFCKEAKKETEIVKVIEKLKTALSLYPTITAWESLIGIIQKNPDQKLEKEDLISASEVFVKRERDLDAAIKRIQAEGDNKEWKGIWKEAWLYISKMSFELKEVSRYKIIVDKLRGEEKVDTDEVDCYSLVESIREIKKREISDYGKDIKSVSLFKDPVIRDCLKAVVNIVTIEARVGDKKLFNVERNDVIGITSSCFWIFIKERDFSYKDTSSFKSYLIESLKQMVLDQLRHEE